MLKQVCVCLPYLSLCWIEAIFLSPGFSQEQLYGVETSIPGVPSLYTKAFLALQWTGWGQEDLSVVGMLTFTLDVCHGWLLIEPRR